MAINETMMKWGGLGVAALALFVLSFSVVSSPQSLVMRYWTRYCHRLESKLRSMFIFMPGRNIALGQLAGVFLVLAATITVDLPMWWLCLLFVIAIPPWYIERRRKQRVEAIEQQLDGFLTALANALKATPSIANAFISVQQLLPSPLKEEVGLATKEMRVGSTLDQALLNMAGRVGCKQLDSALSAVLIGRQVGGDLPHILETTSSTLREMARLEGVVKSKTAEGRAQAWVLAVFPFLLAWAVNSIKPGYFDPLNESVIGWVIALVAGGCWVASILLARKVLSVDL
jgi:tight adherence protein B